MLCLQVHDDGEGITPNDIQSCGLLNRTSKISHPSQLYAQCIETYGFRGQALAAISSFSFLEIISCSRSWPDRTSKTIVRDGNLQPCVSSCSPRSNCGTSVYCRDMFFNRPVVRKVKTKLFSEFPQPDSVISSKCS